MSSSKKKKEHNFELSSKQTILLQYQKEMTAANDFNDDEVSVNIEDICAASNIIMNYYQSNGAFKLREISILANKFH